MSDAFYELVRESSPLGISFFYFTTPGGYHPLHWHEEVELLYPLNGEMEVNIEGKKYQIPKRHFILIESCLVHSTYAYDRTSMQLCIHISKNQLQSYLPDIDLYRVHCAPTEVPEELFPAYYRICSLLADMTRSYIGDAPVFQIEAEGLILQICALLLRDFSASTALPLSDANPTSLERIRQVIRFVEEHFQEPVSLDDMTELLGLSKEYFCRFFKKTMGISFLQYLNEVRLTHVYQDLQNTDLTVSEIMEENGFTNQKLFNREFKKLYGCTPINVRQTARKNYQSDPDR